MQAAVFHAPKTIRIDTVDDPKLEQPRDAIVKVTATAICGSDLHIYNGLFPQVRPLVMGHEFMGIIEEVGPEVNNLERGDRVIVPFPVACGGCFFCTHELPTHCEHSNPEHYGPEGDVLSQKGGGLFGYTDLYGGYAGGQAEYVRVPYADTGPRKVPDSLGDEQALFLTDIFPTGWSGVHWAEPKGGETVAVFGCGPVGIMAQKAAWLHNAGQVIGIDIEPYRLEMAKRAAGSVVINASEQNPAEVVRHMTEGRGADICIDAVGMEANRSFLDKAIAAVHMERGTIDVLKTALSAVRRGGVVSVLGVYGTSYDRFPLGQIFDKGVSLKTGQAPVQAYVDSLIELVAGNKIRLDDIITHRLPLAEAAYAYDIFNRKEDNCLKVILKP